MPSASEIKARLRSISPVEDKTYYVEDAFATALSRIEEALKSVCESLEVVDVDGVEMVDETEAGGIWESHAMVKCDDTLFRVSIRAETNWIYEMTFPEVEEIRE
jgi:uncharacterized protein YxjI